MSWKVGGKGKAEVETYSLEPSGSCNSLWAIFTDRESEMRRLNLPLNSSLRTVSDSCCTGPGFDRECGMVDPGSDDDGPESDAGCGLASVDGSGSDADGPGSDVPNTDVDDPGSDANADVDGPVSNGLYGLFDGHTPESSGYTSGLFDDPGSNGGVSGG